MSLYNYKGYGKELDFEILKNPLKKEKELSIIIPTYNEEGNLEEIVKEIKNVLNSTKFRDSHEIVVVDDSSKDKTPEIMNKLVEKGYFIALHRKKRGIFTAVLDGIKVSNGKFVLTMDADFSHPPEIIPKILAYANDYDIVSASRFIKGGGMESPFIRRVGSKLLNRICGIIIGLNIRDLGGNFRLFKKDKFLALPLKYNSIFGEFGFEIFYRAKKLNYKIKEVPFTYYFRKEGKSKMGNLFKYGMAYLKRAFELRFEN
ncbi:glycosyltransferase [Candidatus Pacearchaeota archaeon]|nr:glycosyltransferase [Candidatus Pacearchaeota archaeon]